MEELNTFLELARELTVRAEEIGRLKAEAEMKDKLIAGLTAQLSMGLSVVSQPVATSKEESLSTWNNSTAKVETANIQSIEPSIESVKNIEVQNTEVSDTKSKAGRPKKEVVEKKSATVKVEKDMSGGSVFKEFVPLELDNLVTENSTAYMPKKKSNILSVL